MFSMNIMLRHWGEKPFISIHIHSFIVFHCISLYFSSKLSKLWQSGLKTGQHTGSNLPNQAFAPQPAPLWIHWALRCPHGCLQEETNSCHWCVQLLQCLLGVPDWQRSLSNDKPGAAARGDGTLGFGPRMPSHCHHCHHGHVSKLGTPKSHGVWYNMV